MKHALLSCVALCCPMVSPLLAQDVPTTQPAPASTSPDAATALPRSSMDQLIVTASRTSEPLFNAPYSVDVVGQTQIADRLIKSTPDALREVPGVMIQKTSPGQGSPYIRGFTGFRNLLLIDGIRLNNATFREGPNQYWNTIDPLSLARLEVVKGPSSVLYGSDAIGGTVNAITKSPASYSDGIGFDGHGYYRFASAERSHMARLELDATWQHQLGFLLGGTLKDFGDVESGGNNGRQPNTGYPEHDVDFKTEFFFNPDTRLVLAHQHVRQNNVPRTHRTNLAESYAGTTIGTDKRLDLDQARDLTYLQFHAENIDDGFLDALHASLSWHVQREDQDRIVSNNSRRFEGFEDGQLGFFVQMESRTALGTLNYGVEYYRDFVNSYSSTNVNQGPIADDANYDLLGLFLQDTLALTDTLDLIVGGRYTYAAVDARSVNVPGTNDRIGVSNAWDALAGSARAVWTLDDARHWNVFGGVSQGFRAPNISDLTTDAIVQSGVHEEAALGLEPEYFLSFETGVKARYDDLSLQATFFHMLIDDMIVRMPLAGGAATKVNAGDGYVQGIELGASWRFLPQWTLAAAATWMEGYVDQIAAVGANAQPEPLSRVQPETLILALRWDSTDRRFWIEGVANLVAKADQLSSSDATDTQRIPPGGTPGYAVFSLRGGWRATSNIHVLMGLENLTNEEYRVHGSGSNEPGLNFTLGVDVTF